MPEESQVKIRALAYLDLLDARRRELSSYVEGITGKHSQREHAQRSSQISVDDLLLEAFELGDQDASDDVIHAAFLIRAEQLGLTHEVRRPDKMLHRIKSAANSRMRMVLTRIAAMLVCAIAISGIAVGAAYAFKWTALMKIFDPIAEVFGMTTENNLPAITKSDSTSMGEKNYDPSQSHISIDGYPATMGWIPDRYSFSYSISNLEYESIKTQYICYSGPVLELTLSVNVLGQQQEALLLYEKDGGTHANPMTISGYEVIASTNINYRSSTWISGQAVYKLSGEYTDDELEKMVSSIMGG